MIISLIYLLIILCLIIIRKYQKKSLNKKEEYHVHSDFKGIDLTRLQKNYDILNKMLDNMKTGKKQYDKKVS